MTFFWVLEKLTINLCTIISYADQARIHKFLEKTKKKMNVADSKSGDISETSTDELEKVTKEKEKLRKKVTSLMKKQKLEQAREIVKQQDDSKPWGQDAHVKVCDL